MLGMLDMARFLRISQPRPPAPTTRTRAVERADNSNSFGDEDERGSNSPLASLPVSLPKGDARDRIVASDPRS